MSDSQDSCRRWSGCGEQALIENSPCWQYEFGDLPFAIAVMARFGVRSSQFAAVGAGDQRYSGSGQSVRDVAGQAEGQSQDGPEASVVFLGQRPSTQPLFHPATRSRRPTAS